MNRYEAILLDKMVGIAKEYRVNPIENMQRHEQNIDEIILLLDCIIDFREPPKNLSLEDGFGAMVAEGGEVV